MLRECALGRQRGVALSAGGRRRRVRGRARLHVHGRERVIGLRRIRHPPNYIRRPTPKDMLERPRRGREPPAFPRGSRLVDLASRAPESEPAQFIKEPQDILLILGELGEQDLDGGAAPDAPPKGGKRDPGRPGAYTIGSGLKGPETPDIVPDGDNHVTRSQPPTLPRQAPEKAASPDRFHPYPRTLRRAP